MNILGEKEIFGIEWSLSDCFDSYYYGHLCFWIGNNRVGNFEEVTTLSISASYLKDFLQNQSFRFYENSHNMNKEELFYLLYERFFNGNSIRDGSYLHLSKFRDLFWLDEVGEYSFRDKIGIVLINENSVNRQRLLWKGLDNGFINEFFIPTGYFDGVAFKFIDKLGMEMKKLTL